MRPVSERRFTKTHQSIQDAFMALLASSRTLEEVNVAQICRRAQIHRTTFYTHFSDKYEVLEQCLMELLSIPEDFVAESSRLDLGSMLKGEMKYIAARCSQHRDFLLSILEDGRYPAYHHLFASTMEQGLEQLVGFLRQRCIETGTHIDENCQVFLGGALFNSLMHWTKTGKIENLDSFCTSITAYILACLRVSDGKALGPQSSMD